MGPFAVQALEGARKVITNTNAPFLANNWWISGKSSNRFPLTAASNKVRTFSTNDTKRVLHCDLPEVSIPNVPFPEMCWARLEEFRERVALVDFPTGNQLTFGQARDFARQVACGFVNLGAQPGQVVAIVLPNSCEHVLTFLGASEAGLVVTSLNPAATAGEIHHQLANSKADYLVTLPLMLSKVQEAIGHLDIQVVLAGEADLNHQKLSLSSLVKLGNDEKTSLPFIDPASTCWLPYSSGTTGRPKGVRLSHANLVANMAQLDHPTVRFIEDKATTLLLLPLFHIGGLNIIMSHGLSHGATQIILPSFDPVMFLEILTKHRPNTMLLVPPLIQFLAQHPAVTADHLASIENLTGGAAPIGLSLLDQMHQKAPHIRIREAYGMTETAGGVTITRGFGHTGGSSGQLVPNTSLKVVEASTGEELGPQETRELCFKGPQVMVEYLDNPEATLATLKDGWCHTGDLGYYDQEGNVFIVDRIKELIKVKGLQVAPAELEDTIRGLEGVDDVAVIGVPHHRSGEVPRAYVIRGDQALNEADIKAHVGSNLSEYKQLEGGVEFVDVIPKSAAGKILRKELKADFLSKL